MSAAAVAKNTSAKLQTLRFAGAAGLSIVADVGGPLGAPLVCLMPGGGLTRHSWKGTPGLLAAMGYRVVSMDLRGHGESGWAQDGDYGLPVTAEDIVKVVRANDQGRGFFLVGASWGGLASLVAAPILQQSGALRGIVLVDVVPRPDPRGGERVNAFMRAHLDGFADIDAAIAAIAAFRPGRPPGNAAAMMRNLRQGEDGRLYWHWDPARLDRRPFIDSDLIEHNARSITVPVLLIRGGNSKIVSDDGVAQLRQLVPQLELIEIENAGHLLASDVNHAFTDVLAAFLGRVAASKAEST